MGCDGARRVPTRFPEWVCSLEGSMGDFAKVHGFAGWHGHNLAEEQMSQRLLPAADAAV